MANSLRHSLLGVDGLLKQIGSCAGAPIAKAVNDQMLSSRLRLRLVLRLAVPYD